MSSHGEKKNPDKMNVVGVATVGFAGCAFVYLAITGIEAVYLNETARVDEVAKFGQQGQIKDTLKSDQLGKILYRQPTLAVTGPKAPNGTQLYTVPIEAAMQLVIRDAAVDPANLVPAVSRSEFTTIKPVFGRPQNLAEPLPLGQSAPPPPPPPVDPTAPVDPSAPPTGAAPTDAPPAGGAAAPAPATPTPAAPAAPTPAPAPAGNPR